ncbi:MAG TPA: hypothetical protein VHZ53_03460 [Steroidobacteraceae bacterium]|jgi:hypothetical protein|nr:hypothetical protein [Steroidobacteraceae bacterium]
MIKTGMAVIGLLFASGWAHADDYPSPTNERVRLSIGAVRVSTSTNVLLDSSIGLPGNAINAEDTFGLSGSDFEAKFQIVVRAGERHRLRFDYFSLDRTGNTTLGANALPIVFKDVVFEQGDPIETNMSLRTLGISYEYSFIHRERFEVAAALGLNDTDISLRARVQTEFRHVDQREDQAGPLPTLGLDATYVLSKRFYVDGRFQYMKASIDHLDGLLSFYEVSAQYRLRPNIAFALGYTSIKAYVDSRQPKDSGYFNFVTRGPEMFVRVAF